MKSPLFALVAMATVLPGGGCQSLDLTPPHSADRVVTGVVNNDSGADLSKDSEVTVRVMDFSGGEERAVVLGEQTLKNPGRMPVPFRIEYRAEDAQLARSVSIEARVSVGGHLRYVTASRHPITVGNVDDSHVLEVELAVKR